MSETKLADPLLPDLAAAPKVRRAPKHDFKDGNGRVFAHRHDNGGGWVADTAWVAPTARVTRNAQVYGFARVHNECEITGRANVFGHAQLFNHCALLQDASVAGNATLRDRCTLRGWARVFESAALSGTTSCDGHVWIYGAARVHSSRFNGPPKNFISRVCDSAQLISCTLSESFTVQDAALCERSHFCNVIVWGDARTLNTSLRCDRNWEYWSYLNGRITEPPSPPIEFAVIDFGGVAINSNLRSRPLIVGSRVLFAHATLHLLDDQPDYAMFNDGTPRRFVDINAYNLAALNRELARRHAPADASVPVFQAPNFDAVRQRRVMRLEDNS